jgi:hypothetical protein
MAFLAGGWLAWKRLSRMKQLFGRRTLFVGFLMLLLLTPCAWYGHFSTAITYFTCAFRLRIGMSLKEVESVLGHGEKEVGGPPGTPDHSGVTIPIVQGDECYRWYKDGVEIFVGFRDGRVCGKRYWFEIFP